MKINNILAVSDPSRYTVYEMLDYAKTGPNWQLIQKQTTHLLLCKSEPFTDDLYNYAHVLGEEFDAGDVTDIKNFFGTANFRITITESKKLQDSLAAHGFKFKDDGYVMTLPNLAVRDYNYSLPDNVKILAVDNEDILKAVKMIFAEAFNHTVAEYDSKFGFLDKIILDNNNKNVKAFVLYENDIPVSTGTYYAFSNFSIENIGTLKIARDRGYANLIVRTLLQAAQKLNYSGACLVASEAGSHVYKKLGFEVLSKANTYIKI